MHDIYHFENELALHCAIEDEILLPALAKNDQTIKTHQLDIPNETEELSVREKEVLVHIVKGLSNKEIADAIGVLLGISTALGTLDMYAVKPYSYCGCA